MSKITSTIYIYNLKPSVLLFVRNQVISNCIDANWHFILYRWKNGDPSSVTLFYWNIIWKNSIRVNERHFSSEVLYNWIMKCDRTFHYTIILAPALWCWLGRCFQTRVKIRFSSVELWKMKEREGARRSIVSSRLPSPSSSSRPSLN